ncbi:MAG: AAA family ATPase, partial [Erysipelotrichaceae bacterium]
EEDKKIEDLSLGNLKKVGIVLAFMHEPELVILDEATSGLDPIMQRNFYSLLKEEKRKGTTIIYSTHILKEVADICDRVGIVKDGQLIKTDSVKAFTDKRLLKVKIEAPDLQSILSDLDIKTDITNNSCSFNYDDDINKLIQTLNKYQIERINIEEPSIEDVFMHYYR